jgi:uncharacterized membrane protein
MIGVVAVVAVVAVAGTALHCITVVSVLLPSQLGQQVGALFFSPSFSLSP